MALRFFSVQLDAMYARVKMSRNMVTEMTESFSDSLSIEISVDSIFSRRKYSTGNNIE